MSQHPTIQYRLQSGITPSLTGQSHVLFTAHYPALEPVDPRAQRWCFTSSGPLKPESVARLDEAWRGAQSASVERSLSVLGSEPTGDDLEALTRPKQPLSVQLKQLSTQLYSFEEPETTMELEFDLGDLVEPPTKSSGEFALEPKNVTPLQLDQSREPTHLVICLAQESRHNPPPARDVQAFESVTLFIEDDSPLVWPWVAWCTQVGAQLIVNDPLASKQLEVIIHMSARYHGRSNLLLRPTLEGKLHSIVSLNAPVTGRLAYTQNPIRLPFVASNQRLAWLVSVEPKHHGDGARELLLCEVNGERQVIQDYPVLGASLESAQPAVSFAHQLAHRGRILEQIISSYLSSDLRRVVHGLDQWLKISVSLESELVSAWIHQMKVKFLHLGRFEQADLRRVIRHALHVPYKLTSDGVWIKRQAPRQL